LFQLPFELDGRQHPFPYMLSPWFVEHPDEIEHILSRLFARSVNPALYPLTLARGGQQYGDWMKG
jgi:hypothetical protein